MNGMSWVRPPYRVQQKCVFNMISDDNFYPKISFKLLLMFMLDKLRPTMTAGKYF